MAAVCAITINVSQALNLPGGDVRLGPGAKDVDADIDIDMASEPRLVCIRLGEPRALAAPPSLLPHASVNCDVNRRLKPHRETSLMTGRQWHDTEDMTQRNPDVGALILLIVRTWPAGPCSWLNCTMTHAFSGCAVHVQPKQCVHTFQFQNVFRRNRVTINLPCR